MLTLFRFLAAAIDLALILTCVFSVGYTASDIGVLSCDSLLFRTASFAFPFLYYGFLDSEVGGGGTLGKRLLGLQLRRQSGSSVRLYVVLSRTVLKLGVPILLFKAGATLAFSYPSVASAVMLAACLILPISIAVGSGSTCLHDLPFKTRVTWRRSESGEAPGRSSSSYWGLSVLSTGVIVLSMVIATRIGLGLEGRSRLPGLLSIAKASEPLASVASEILKEKGGESIQRFVKDVQVMPSIEKFPDQFRTSFTTVSPEMIKQLHGRPGELLISVEVSEHGLASFALKSSLIQRVSSVVMPLVASREVTKFVWLQIGARKTFGPVRLLHGNSCMLIGRRRPESRLIDLAVAEPDNNLFSFVSFELGGFWIHPDSLAP